MPQRKAVWLELSEIERNELERLVRRHKTAQALALRARIILLAADGLSTAIAARLGVDLHRVGRWRQRFAGLRLDGLFDEPRPEAPRKIGDLRYRPERFDIKAQRHHRKLRSKRLQRVDHARRRQHDVKDEADFCLDTLA